MVFKGVDFFRIDDLLSDEERMVRDTVRRFVDERVVPIIDKHFEDGTFPQELVPEMAALGLFGGNLPEEYGCANMNNVAYGLVMQGREDLLLRVDRTRSRFLSRRNGNAREEDS
jgi:glutaryl-CoA dehydrogenase